MAQDSGKTTRCIIFFIRSRAEENVKNEPLLLPRGRLHSISAQNKYRSLQMNGKVAVLSPSCSLHISQARVAIHICPDLVNVTDDADFCISTRCSEKNASDAPSARYWSHNELLSQFHNLLLRISYRWWKHKAKITSRKLNTRKSTYFNTFVPDILIYTGLIRPWF